MRRSHTLVPVLLAGLVPILPAPVAAGESELGVALMSAVLDQDGTLRRQQGAIGGSKPATGSYLILFAREINDCAFTATIGQPGRDGTSPPSFVSVARSYAKDNGIVVETRDKAGAPADRSFHLTVFCGT